MKVTAKRTHIVLKLTKAEVMELQGLLGDALHDKVRKPLTWAMKPHKKRAKLLAELAGVVHGVTRSGRDPDAGPDDFGGNPYDDDDLLWSPGYAVAYREAKRIGMESTRR